ncbi:MAG: hypothetical protein ACLFWB_03975 [Armatimonadota bacterium]
MVKLGDWLSEGWEIVKEDWLTYGVAALLASLIGGITFGICAPPMAVGMFMMIDKKMKGQQPAIGDVFGGFQKFGPSFVAAILVGLGVFVVVVVLNFIPIVGQIAGAILGFVVGGAMFYMFPLIADTDIGGVDAIKRSWEHTQPEIVMYSVTYLVYSLVAQLGVIACGIGIFVSWPIMLAAQMVAYRDVVTSEGGAAPAEPAPAAPEAPPAAPSKPQAPAEEEEAPAESGWEDTSEEEESAPEADAPEADEGAGDEDRDWS